MAEGPTKAAPRRPFCGDGDLEAGVPDASCADSCSSLDELRRPGSRPASRPGSDVGSPRWETPRGASAGGRGAKWEPGDANDGHKPDDGQLLGGLRGKCGCGALIALVCLLLMLGSFLVPKSDTGLGSVMVSVTDLGSRATAGVRAGMRQSRHAGADESAIAAQAERHCRPQQRGGNSTVQV